MNLTIPKRPYNPAHKWSGSIQSKRSDRKRYAISIITAVFIIGALITGSIGSLLQVAEAKPNYGAYFNNLKNRNAEENSSSRTTNETTTTSRTTNTTSNTTTTVPAATTTTTQQATQTPVQTQPAAPAPAAATRTPATQHPATVQPVAAAQQTAGPVVDTAPEVAALTAAQAKDSAATAKTITYTSNKISDETRDRIFILAAVTGITATLLYIMSLIGSGEPALRKQQIPVRYIVPIKEGALR